jgi:hypothetical protein
MNMENRDILDVLKWFNNPDNMKGTDTVAWVPRRVLAAAIAEIRNLREQNEENVRNEQLPDTMWIG